MSRQPDPVYVSPEEREKQLAVGWQERLYPVGPDVSGDIRLHRPYFLLCVVRQTDEDPDLAAALERVKKWVAARQQEGAAPVTDLYVLSHGWHRNLYGSVAAYDRLISRLQLLHHRQGLRTPTPYHPLFLAIHWHSDPGENHWRDTSGRRSKESFISNARTLFEGRDPDFQNDFEDLYALMAKMSEGMSRAEVERRRPSDTLAQQIDEILHAPDLRPREIESLRAVIPVLKELNDPLGAQAKALMARFRHPEKGYRLKHAPPRGREHSWTAEETAAAWSCYHEAAPERVRLGQDRPTGRFVPVWRKLARVLKVLLLAGAAALVLVAAFRGLPYIPRIGVGLFSAGGPIDLWRPPPGSPVPLIFVTAACLIGYGFAYALAPWRRFARPREDEHALPRFDFERDAQMRQQRLDAIAAPILLGLYGLGVGYFGWLALFAAASRLTAATALLMSAGLYLAGGGVAEKVQSIHDLDDQPQSQSTWYSRLIRFPIVLFSVPELQIAAWAPIQVLFSLPLLLYVVATRLTGRLVEWHKPDEKFQMVPGSRLRRRTLAYLLAVVAASPARIAHTTLPAGNRFHRVLDIVESQLAFWEMQRRAAVTGAAAAHAIAQLVASTSGLDSPRVHFVGHSFGGLVAANAANQFMIEQVRAADAGAPLGATIDSLTLVLPAMASDWFVDEKPLRDAVRGTIACLYSHYDTANGFYYPLANHGRLSAGFVGLFGGKAFTPVVQRDLVSLVKPPDLKPGIISLDLSRICRNGPAAAGGGHGDVFKDDVLHVVWAVTTARSLSNQDPVACAD